MIFKLISQKDKFAWLKIRGRQSGVVLIIVLWVLVILSVLAISLGRKTNIELALTKNAIGKTQAKFISWAGVVYAINHIFKDTKDKMSKNIDTFYYCGIRNSLEISPEKLFSKRKVGDGYFDIVYSQASDDAGGYVLGTTIGETFSKNRAVDIQYGQGYESRKKKFYGLSDEERKININGLTQQNYKILNQLIMYLGYDEEVANIISASVVDWSDGDANITDGANGAENEYYESLSKPYRTKNTYFDIKEELLLVRGMTKEVYRTLKEYITVFPRGGNLQVNFDTATAPVLFALARSVSGSLPAADENDANSLVEKILVYRRGEDGVEYTEDDNIVEAKGLALNAIERNIFLTMNRYRAKISQFLNVQVAGFDTKSGARSYIEAIVSRDEYSIVYWRRR